VTAPRFRRRRQDGRAPAFAGDFPDDGRDITEVLQAAGPPAWDGTAIEWGGASDAGLPDGGAYPAAVSPAGDYRRAIAQANAEGGLLPRTPYPPYPDPAPAPLRALPRGPDMFPALPPGSPPAQHDPRDTGPQQRLPRYARTAARPRPQRAPDCAIFIWSDLLGQHIMKCGVCLRSRYADPIAAHMPFTFEALRVSAHVSGWRLDAFSRWACPACQGTVNYRTPHCVTFWDMDTAAFRSPGGWPARHWIERLQQERPVTEDHDSPYHAMHAGDPAAEFWITAEAEVDVRGRAAGGVKRGRPAEGVKPGRHAAVAR
jgi:hypothetical protein